MICRALFFLDFREERVHISYEINDLLDPVQISQLYLQGDEKWKLRK